MGYCTMKDECSLFEINIEDSYILSIYMFLTVAKEKTWSSICLGILLIHFPFASASFSYTGHEANHELFILCDLCMIIPTEQHGLNWKHPPYQASWGRKWSFQPQEFDSLIVMTTNVNDKVSMTRIATGSESCKITTTHRWRVTHLSLMISTTAFLPVFWMCLIACKLQLRWQGLPYVAPEKTFTWQPAFSL